MAATQHSSCSSSRPPGSEGAKLSPVLVTGAAGFIGSHTVDALLEAGYPVIGVDNYRTGRRENLASATQSRGFSMHEMDVAEEGAFDRLVEAAQPAAIIHLAALVSVPESIERPDENFRLNVWATHVIAEAARRHGVGRLVFASSAAVYGRDEAVAMSEDAVCEPKSPYGAAKLASEALLQAYARSYGFTVRCQRFFNVYGARQDPGSVYSGVISRFAQACIEGRKITIYGDGRQVRDFVAVRDVARANVIAATSPGLETGVANICSGTGTDLNTLVKLIGQLRSRPIEVDYASPRAGDIRYSIGHPERAERELHFTAQLLLEKGMREFVHSLAG